MKKINLNIRIICLIVLSFLSFNIRGEVVGSFTKWIDFQSGFVGSAMHPNLRLVRFDTTDPNYYNIEGFYNNELYLSLSSKKNYYKFGSNTIVLIKFIDDTVIELHSIGEAEYDEDYIINTKFYNSFREFELSDTDLQQLLTLPIKKVRIELFNGEILDYEVNNKHGKKVLKQIQEEWNKVLQEQDRKRNNTNKIREDF